jgi:hypothetical protein
MAYTPQLPQALERTLADSGASGGTHICQKAVTPVTEVTEILDMSISRFAQAGRAVEVRVPWLDDTLWWVSGLEQVKRLLDRGVSRGRILTAGELANLGKVTGTHLNDAIRLVRMKAAFGATLLSVDLLSDEDPPSCERGKDLT